MERVSACISEVQHQTAVDWRIGGHTPCWAVEPDPAYRCRHLPVEDILDFDVEVVRSNIVLVGVCGVCEPSGVELKVSGFIDKAYLCSSWQRGRPSGGEVDVGVVGNVFSVGSNCRVWVLFQGVISGEKLVAALGVRGFDCCDGFRLRQVVILVVDVVDVDDQTRLCPICLSNLPNVSVISKVAVDGQDVIDCGRLCFGQRSSPNPISCNCIFLNWVAVADMRGGWNSSLPAPRISAACLPPVSYRVHLNWINYLVIVEILRLAQL